MRVSAYFVVADVGCFRPSCLQSSVHVDSFVRKRARAYVVVAASIALAAAAAAVADARAVASIAAVAADAAFAATNAAVARASGTRARALLILLPCAYALAAR